MRQARHLQAPTRDTTGFERINFPKQRGQIDNNAISDHRSHGVVQNTARGQLQGIFLIAYDNGMTGVVTALIAGDILVGSGQKVDDFGLTFVTPLGTYNNSDGHTDFPFGT